MIVDILALIWDKCKRMPMYAIEKSTIFDMVEDYFYGLDEQVELDLEEQEEVNAGGSGPVCSALVNFSYIFDQLKKKKLKRVLLIATGALFSPTMVYQKENINSIAHAISLEAV